MTKPKRQDTRYEPEGPAVVTDDFAQTRHITTRAGARKGWERLAVYEQEFRKGHLCCNLKCRNTDSTKAEVERAFARRDAAKEFDEGWATCNASWPAGLDLSRVRVVGCPGGFVDHQRDVKDFWRRVELAMGVNDWMICRRICGEGVKVGPTILAIAPAYRHTTMVRFREALDALIAAMEKSRRRL